MLNDKTEAQAGRKNYFLTRLSPARYSDGESKVKNDAGGKRWVRSETHYDSGLRSVKMDFPDDDDLILKSEHGRSEQATSPTGYHITICYGEVY